MKRDELQQAEEMLLPAWSKEKRRKTTILLTLFVFICSLFFGLGVYSIGLQKGFVSQPITKKFIYDSVMADGGFVRAVRQAATLQSCENEELGYGYQFQSPLMVVEDENSPLCSRLVAVHPSGADVFISIQLEDQSRRSLVNELVAEFDVVDTDILTGLPYTISRLSGFVEGTSTAYFVIERDAFSSYLISYAPTSPVLNGKVSLLVEKFWFK
jgi:hypothetical protein